MTLSTIPLIGFILAGVTALAGGILLFRSWRLWKKQQPVPAAPDTGADIDISSPPGHSGTMLLPSDGCYKCGGDLKPTASFCPHCGTGLVIANRYKIIRQIGQGGMGAVYLVDDRRLKGRQWAMKEFSDAGITGPLDRQEAIKNFQAEAELLAKLEHPNLPQVIDFLSQNSRHYLVMDYIEGETLETLLSRRQQQPFSEPEVLLWAGQLCDVLAYLHSQTPPIIFRDLKPANIILTPKGRVRLIDFGIARLFKSGKAGGDTLRLGTPGYAAPEQYGREQSDVRSDVYALGVTLHRLLTGHDPADTPFALPNVRHLNPSVSGKVEQAIEQAIQSEAAYRFQTVSAMKRALGL